jgi:ribonuclease HII
MPKMSKDTFLRSLVCGLDHEETAYGMGATRIAGIDECGVGSWVGPVTAGIVILEKGAMIEGLRDSKLISPKKRIRLAEEIKAKAVGWSVVHVSASEIDRSNVRVASQMAMYEAIHLISPSPDFLLIDAVAVDIPISQWSIVHGDAVSASIAAASIIAKVARDALMVELDLEYPGFNFDVHKGYGTKAHMEALLRLGPTPQHRMSFAPLKNLPRMH